MEIPIGEEAQMIYIDQKAAQECYSATVKVVEKIEEESNEHNKTPKLELDGQFELFVLDMQKPEHTKIGKDLPIDLRKKLAKILVEYKDIFAWSSSDLGTVPCHIAEKNFAFLREQS